MRTKDKGGCPEGRFSARLRERLPCYNIVDDHQVISCRKRDFVVVRGCQGCTPDGLDLYILLGFIVNYWSGLYYLRFCFSLEMSSSSTSILSHIRMSVRNL